jgi:hypothetical protein
MNAIKLATLAVVVALSAVACGPADGGDPTGGDPGSTGNTGGGDGGNTVQAVTPNCAGFCSVMQAANCGDAPANCTSQCNQIINASPACSNIQARFFNCVAGLNSAQVQCSGGVTYAPACDSLAKLTGVSGCASAVNKTACYGTPCKYDSDCGSSVDYECNSATNRCLKRGSVCTGLPCIYDSDCGDVTNYTCNSELDTCVHR